MARQLDPVILASFIDEARRYLPDIRAALRRHGLDPTRAQDIEEATRLVQMIRGSAAAVGLAALSSVAALLESLLDELAQGKIEPTAAGITLCDQVLDQIEAYVSILPECGPDDLPDFDEAAELIRQARAACKTSGLAAPAEAGNNSIAPVDGIQELPVDLDAEEEVDDTVAPELLEVFGLEAEDHLRTISALLPQLAGQPDSREIMQEVRRSAHTLKGSAAMVGFGRITRLAHRMEDLLDLLYEGSRPVTPEVIQLLHTSTDALEDLAAGRHARVSLTPVYAAYNQLLGTAAETPAAAALTGSVVGGYPPDPPFARGGAASANPPFARGGAASATPHFAKGGAESATPSLTSGGSASANPTFARGGPATAAQTQFVRVPIERLDELVKLVSELVIARSQFEQRMGDYGHQTGELQLSADRLQRVSRRLDTKFEVSALASSHGRSIAVNGRGTVPHLPSPVPQSGQAFDDLEMDRYTEFHLLTRELAETANDIQTVGGELAHLLGDFDSYLNRQTRLASEIEDKLMRLRMIPLATLTSRLQRTVRNVAAQQGKQVELAIDGESTELDKTVLEEMADPLLHLLRNAVDHGIEPATARTAQGKPEQGTIRLRAGHEGSQTVIQITDDGAGIDPRLVRSSALDRGFLTAAEADRLSDTELMSLLFLPGFSTAPQLSEVSGRGVGLDVVQAKVHRLKGTIQLESHPGKGTTFTIRLPMTLAITRALLVRAGKETLALPLDAIRQIIRLEEHELEQVGRDPVLRVGGQVYPVFWLSKLLSLRSSPDEQVSRPPVLIVYTGVKQVALIVDQLIGGREIVIKNLGTHLRRVRGVAGATLMGDGRVVLILNPAELLADPATLPKAPRLAPVHPQLAPVSGDSLTVMVVDDSPSVRRVVTQLIQNAGWKSNQAKDGIDALEVLQHARSLPDLILMDIEMPRMDGFELLATLQSQDSTRPIPKVMVTSRAGDKHRRKALDLGAVGYVVKPYQEEALIVLVRDLVREARQGAPI